MEWDVLAKTMETDVLHLAIVIVKEDVQIQLLQDVFHSNNTIIVDLGIYLGLRVL